MKIGFRASAPKIRGFRNTFDITPMYRGQAIKPETNCGPKLIAKYGEFLRFQEGQGFAGRHSVEKQSDNEYILVEATNSDDVNWNPNGTYRLAGWRRFCVSWPHLPVWRCQDGTMSDRGQLQGFGQNDRGYDLPKR